MSQCQRHLSLAFRVRWDFSSELRNGTWGILWGSAPDMVSRRRCSLDHIPENERTVEGFRLAIDDNMHRSTMYYFLRISIAVAVARVSREGLASRGHVAGAGEGVDAMLSPRHRRKLQHT